MGGDVVSFQGVLLVKPFLTKLTFEWLIGCMCTHVSVERGSKSERLPTDVTPVRSVASVSMEMSLEVSFLVKPFTTVLAGEQSHV